MAENFVTRAAAFGVQVDPRRETGWLTVDLARYEVRLGDRPLDLSPRQVELLALFVAAPGRVWSRAQLHAVCWGDDDAHEPSRRVDVQLCRIRNKAGSELFRNIRDRGWALREPISVPA